MAIPAHTESRTLVSPVELRKVFTFILIFRATFIEAAERHAFKTGSKCTNMCYRTDWFPALKIKVSTGETPTLQGYILELENVSSNLDSALKVTSSE